MLESRFTAYCTPASTAPVTGLFCGLFGHVPVQSKLTTRSFSVIPAERRFPNGAANVAPRTYDVFVNDPVTAPCVSTASNSPLFTYRSSTPNDITCGNE